MYDLTDLRTTIVPKSDQLNSEQLITGPMTITVSEVKVSSSDEQPVIVHYEGDNGRPFKPCKTMRKVIVLAWGEDGRTWAGKSMTLYNDPNVKFGGAEVGGIRISHMTDIERDIRVSLTATKGKKALYEVKRLESPDASALAAIRAAATVEVLKDLFGRAYKATKDTARRDSLKQAYDMRMAALATPPAGESRAVDRYREAIDNATSTDTASLVLDEAREVLLPADMAELQKAFKMAWEV